MPNSYTNLLPPDYNDPSPVPLTEIGELLVRLRTEKGILQKELAARLGILPASMNRMERTYYRGVAFERLAQVAQALGLRLLVLPIAEASDQSPKIDSAVDR